MTTTPARTRTTVAAVALAATALLGAATPASAAGPANPSRPSTYELDGLYDCSSARADGTSYTKPDGVAFVVLISGTGSDRTYFQSPLEDSNDGDRTYVVDEPIRFVITCLFTDS